MAKGENKVDQVLDIIKEMTILELRDLNQKIQDEFGITAAAPVAVAAAPAAAAGGDGAAPAAVMALALHALFELVDRLAVPRGLRREAARVL